MEVVDEVYPSGTERRAALTEPGPDGPIVMVNLLKFKDRAEYPDGSDSDLSGRDAYMRYAAVATKLVEEYGGRILFAGDVTFLLLGQVERLWDEVSLAEYPNRKSLMDMTTSDAWRAVAHHREAGLAGQLNIETTHAAGFATVTTTSQ